MATHAIKHLSVGDRITVIYHERSYSSVVQDLPAPDTLVIAQPSSMGIYLNLIGQDEGEILYTMETGVLTFQVVQEERFVLDGIPMLRLRAVSDVRRSQRRNYFRLQKTLPVQLSLKAEDRPDHTLTIKANTINISGGGCRIAVKKPVSPDTLLECRISLAPNVELSMDGQVVWLDQPAADDQNNVIGVQFLGWDAGTQKALINFVMDEQRKQIKIGR